MHSKTREVRPVYHRIVPSDTIVTFTEVDESEMYDNIKGGFVRKSMKYEKFSNKVGEVRGGLKNGDQFVDEIFQIQESKEYRLVRLFSLYKEEIALFPEDEESSSYIKKQNKYNTFLAESGIVSFDYLRTLFLTQTVNKEGYYRYFVKRNGEYFMEECDDFIPVDRITYRPLWALGKGHPWQLLLMKAWMKECGSFNGIYEKEPFRFLDAFGLAAYQVFNFRKELRFIQKETLPLEKKKENEKLFAMNKNDVIIIGQTVNSKEVAKVGLIPNIVAYRALRITKPDEVGLYRVYSTLPCAWVGSYSPVVESNLNNVYNKDMFLDLERNFLMTEGEMITYFNKFYVVPFELSEPERIVTQDCLNLKSTQNKPNWISFEVKAVEGMVSLSIELPKRRDNNGKYPEFRYFLSKHKNQEEITRSHFRSDVRGSEREGNIYIESDCDKWDCYGIDYMQGYHNTANLFCRVTEGLYVLYVDADYEGMFNIRVDAFIGITKPEIYHPEVKGVKEIFDSTFFSISQDMGIEASFNNDRFEESISLNNSFEELGFGSISVRTLTKAKHRVAMRIYPDKLRQAGYRLLSHYDHLQKDLNEEKNFVLVSSKGRPEIIVMEKIERRSENTIGQVFPPENAVEFFRIEPLMIYNYH